MYLFFKRIIDILLSFIGLIVCSIPMCVIALAIKIDSKGPVIFKQERLGFKQRNFTIYKFRTMCQGAYDMGGVATRSDDYRITRVGAILRRSSLDELPQMINIIKGDMGIIGPRPILPIEFEKYKNINDYYKRYNVLPGLFCTVDLKDRAADRIVQFKMDVDYTANIKFLTDAKIFFRVIGIVIGGKNVYREEVDACNHRK